MQLADCEAYAKAYGYMVTAVYTDPSAIVRGRLGRTVPRTMGGTPNFLAL